MAELREHFLDPQGRILDHDAGDRTTSEGQSYVLFFALIANDRPRFDRILSWTERSLAQGSLETHLPAWLWENKYGTWQIADRNSASDADLWLAFTLLEAGRLWHDAALTGKGTGLATQMAEHEVGNIAELGPMLLPGSSGFHTPDGFYELNPSYLPVQLLLALHHHLPGGPWGEIAGVVLKYCAAPRQADSCSIGLPFVPAKASLSIPLRQGNRSRAMTPFGFTCGRACSTTLRGTTVKSGIALYQ